MSTTKNIALLALLAVVSLTACDEPPAECRGELLATERPVDCYIEACEIEDGHAVCDFALWLPEGERGQINVRVPGTQPIDWLEAPWHLRAPGFEGPEIEGSGLMCGAFELDLTANWQDELELSCTRYGSGGGVAISTWR